jgi:hypothetical protein
MRNAKRLAARTLTALIEQGLRLMLARSRPAVHRPQIVLPISRAVGGPLPGVDLNDGAAVLDVMEGRN